MLQPLHYFWKLPNTPRTTHKLTVEHIANGRYGEVYTAVNLANGELVVVREYNGNGHKFGLREVQVFKAMPKSKYIINVVGYHWKNNKTVLCVIFQNPPCKSSRGRLDGLIANGAPAELPQGHVELILYHLCVAIDKCHSAGVIHRGITPEKILIDEDKIQVCLSDFRSAKILPLLFGILHGGGSKDGVSPGGDSEDEDWGGNFTPPSEILKTNFHYTAPELLMGAKTYTPVVDMWSLGTIFAEMVNGTTFFQRGGNETVQLQSIFRILGLPSNSERDLVPGVNHFQWSSFENIPRTPRRTLAAAVPRLVPEGVDLLEQMLAFVPEQRISAKTALSHPYFCRVGFTGLW